MEYEATVVLENVTLKPPPKRGDAEKFALQLVQSYLDGRSDQSAEQLAAPTSPADPAAFECPLRKPGWFSRG